MRLFLLGGVAGPVVFFGVVAASAALRDDYGHATSFISELGATGTLNANLMNYAGFLPGGLMLAAFGVALARVQHRDRATMLAALLVALSGAGVAASGIFSCDPGCPQTGGTVENLIHNTIGPITFLCLIVGAGILGLRFRHDPAWRGLWAHSLATAILGLCLLAALAGSLDSRVLTGLWQRLLLAVLFLWCAVVGVWAFLQPSMPEPRS